MTHIRGPVPTSAVGARALYCTEDGVFVWPNIPLIRRRPSPGRGSTFAKCDPLTAWHHLAPWHGEDVNGSKLAGTLTSACAYLNAGDPAEARKWVDRLPLPPLTPQAVAKLGHWQMQPRAPASRSDGGQWVAEDGRGGFSEAVWNPDEAVGAQTVADGPTRPPPGPGHNNPPKLSPIPRSPRPPGSLMPGTPWARFIRGAIVAAGLLARELMQDGGPQAVIDTVNEATRKLIESLPDEAVNYATAKDPPDYLENLHPPEDGSRPATRGYEWHHIVEQTAGRRDFGDERVEERTNLVRLPKYVHESITNWYSRPNPDYGGKTPRDYLRGKSFEEQYTIGMAWLREMGAIK